MATRTCPGCGTQYVATVRRCIDCDTTLVDDVAGTEASPAAGSSPLGDGDQIAYELEGWGNQLKVTLEGMLDQAGIRRVWEAGALVVDAADETTVDDLIATVEGGDVAAPDEDVERVALEIEGLDVDGFAELDARLIAAAVAHAWDDEGALIIAESDEDEVLAIIDVVLEGVEEGDDGLAAQQALSAVFVAVDRLVKDPADPKLARTYVGASRSLVGLDVPYGFATAEWTSLVADAEALAALVDPDGGGVTEADGEAGDVEADGGDEAGGDDDGEVGGGHPAEAGEADDAEGARDRARDLRERLGDLV
jgi:hypothetical protein